MSLVTFEEAAKLPRSEKVVLVTMLASKQVKLFAVHSGNTYVKDAEYFVDSVSIVGAALVPGSGKNTLSSGQMFFDASEKKIYIFSNVDPKTLDISIVFKFFFSAAPLILPHDLSSGVHVEWLPIIDSIGAVGQQLDDESTGIVLESQSTVNFINNHGFFDEIFDTLLWENKSVKFYYWFPVTPLSEARMVFDGVVESRDFSDSKVTFKLRDFVYKLRDLLNLGTFSDTDGKLDPATLGTPKRRIYGQVKQALCVGVDKTLDGYDLSGTVTLVAGELTLNGTGTLFLSEVSRNDELIITSATETFKVGVEDVISNTQITVNKKLELSIVSLPAKNNPAVPYRFDNRVWHVAGHKLREPSAQIQTIISANRFTVNSTLDMFEGDALFIGNDFVTIRRISGNEIVLNNALSPAPLVGDYFVKVPIQGVFFQDKKLIYQRDWTYTNTTEAKITINELAEFNISQEKLLGVSVTFTNGSDTVTSSATVDFRSILKERDWIKKNTITSIEGDWYEILSVSEQSIKLRSPYAGTTLATTALIKNVEYINDDSNISVNALGFESSGLWLKTPSDIVRHLVLNDAGFTSVNEASFTQARADCDYIVSMVLPETIGEKSPQIRETITKINESVFGSLYGNTSDSISYAVLNSEKPDTIEILNDDDIISFSSKSVTEIYNVIKVKYRPFFDFFSNGNTFENITFNSGFVDNNIGIKATHERTLYLYEEDKAQIIAERVALFKSMTNTVLEIKAKANFFSSTVNDKIFVGFDRLFKRIGGSGRLKIGIISGVKRSQFDSEIQVSDIGNIFNRVPAIAPDSAVDYSLQVQNDLVRWGYIVDNDTLTPDVASEDNLGNNLIG